MTWNSREVRGQAGEQSWWRTGDSIPHIALAGDELSLHLAEGSHLNIHLMAHTQTSACRCVCAQASKRFKVSKHATSFKTCAARRHFPKGCVYCRVNRQQSYCIIYVLSRPLCTWGQLRFFSTHSVRLSYQIKIQTPVTISLILIFLCCSASCEWLHVEMRLFRGFWRLAVSSKRRGTAPCSYHLAEYLALFNWYLDGFR